MLKNIAALATNPYVLAAVAIAALGYGIYRYATQATVAEKAMAAHNKRVNDLKEWADQTSESVEGMLSALRDENVLMTKKVDIYEKLKDIYPDELENISLQNFLLMDSVQANNLLATALDERVKAQQRANVNAIEAEMKTNDSRIVGLEGKSGMDTSVGEWFELRRLKSRNEQLKIEYEKAKDIVVQGLKDEAAAEYAAAALDKDNESGKTVLERKIKLTKELAEEEVRLNKLRAPSSTAKNSEITAAEDKVKEIKGKLEALTGLSMKDNNTLASEQSDRLRAIEDYRKSISEAEVQAELDIRQQGIEALDEGSKKELAMIHLNYDRLMDANRKRANEMIKERQELERKQWEYDNPKWKDKGMTFKPTTTKVDQLPESQRNQLLAYDDLADTQRRKATRDHLDRERQAMDEYNAAYGDYQEKRLAITRKYNDLIAKATTEGEKLTLGKEMTKALSDLDLAANKTTSAISRLFGDMSDRTVADMRIIANEGEKALEFLKNGQWDATTGARLGVSEETFNTLKDSPEELEATAQGIKGIREEADQMDTSFGKISGGLKKVFSAGDDSKKLKEGLEEISQGMNDVMQAGQFLSDTFSKLGDAFGNDALKGVAEGLNVAMDAMDSAMQGAKAGAMFGPIGAAAGAAVGAVTSLISSFAKIHDAKNERRIQRLQDQIDVLDKSYEKLGQSIEKAYSKDASGLIDQQNEMLEQQKVLIQQQIMEEEDKKNTDDERIKEWRDQMDEIDKTLADNKEAAKDAIFGEDLKSAIENFADAYANAWASNEDRAKSAKDTVKNMMRQMVTESIKAAVESSGAMEQIRRKLEEFYADNVLQGWEQDYIYGMAEGLQKEIDSQFGWADGLMRDEDKGEAPREASAKGIASISQDSANAMDGKMSSQLIFLDRIDIGVTSIRDQMRFIYDLQVEGWKDVKAIRELSGKVSENTGKVAEVAGRIEELSGKIETNTGKTARGIQDMNDKGLILRK